MSTITARSARKLAAYLKEIGYAAATRENCRGNVAEVVARFETDPDRAQKLEAIIKDVAGIAPATIPVSDLDRIFALIARMPSGLPDPEAYEKLGVERGEFDAAETKEEQIEEAVDRAYYCLKEIFNAAYDVDCSVEELLAALVAKVSFRHQQPKDKIEERRLMMLVIEKSRR